MTSAEIRKISQHIFFSILLDFLLIRPNSTRTFYHHHKVVFPKFTTTVVSRQQKQQQREQLQQQEEDQLEDDGDDDHQAKALGTIFKKRLPIQEYLHKIIYLKLTLKCFS